MDLIPVAAPCVYLERACTFFQMAFQGFPADTTLPVSCTVNDPNVTYPTQQRLPTTGPEGRATIETYDYSSTEHWPGAVQLDDANASYRCFVDGVEEPWTFNLVKLRASIGR